MLPESLKEVEITSRCAGAGSADLRRVRHREDAGTNVTRRAGDVKVVVVK